MSEDRGPWRAPQRAPESSGTRFAIWVGLFALVALGLWQLSRLFPGALSQMQDQGSFVNLAMLAVLIGSGLVYSRRSNASEIMRNIALWIGVVAVLVMAYVVYHRYGIGQELVPGYASEVNPSTIAFTENEDGDFVVHGTVNGTTVSFLVDTGATDIVLSPADAQRVGIDLGSLEFNRRYETANGEGRGARRLVDELSVGPVKLTNVPVSINAAGMRSSLLGMAFLKRMKSFEFRGRKLYLRWR